MIEVNGFQDLAAVAAEAGGGVVGFEAEHRAGEGVGAPAQDLAGQRTLHRFAAGDIATADDEVVTGGDLVCHRGDGGGGMGEVSVHRHDQIAVAGDGLVESGDVGGTQSQLAGAMDDVDAPGVLVGQPVGDDAGAVGRVVVHDDDLAGKGQGEQLRDEPLEIFFFVIGGDDDVGFHVSYSLIEMMA